MSFSLPPVPFSALSTADLAVGRIYEGGTQPHVGADPLHYLTGVGNSGGFRTRSAKGTGWVALCVLFSTGAVTEWPDGWGRDGNYVYFGDQRVPGLDVLDTPRGGNRLLADVANWVQQDSTGRERVPPFLLFEKHGRGRDVRFEGVLVPARDGDWLAEEQREVEHGLITNYRARFSRLPIAEVSRLWISDVLAGDSTAPSAPRAWLDWIQGLQP